MSSEQAPVNPSDSSSDSTTRASDALPFASDDSRRSRALVDEKTVISDRPPVSAEQLSQLGNPLETGKSLLGECLGHFELEEFIGGGGMGAVFRAKDTELGRAVAVKVLSQDQADGDGIRRFRNEAQSAARLDHRNIARVHHVGSDQGWHYIVFEYIQGVNIRDLVDHKGPLPLNEAVAYAMQISEALDHASEREVVHRDIKPSNVIVTPTGRAKLVDMGLARIHGPDKDGKGTELTVSGVTLGTFDYISPEQARDPRATDVRSDIYSLGCTIYFMLIGTPPFPDGTGIQKLIDHNTEAPPDPLESRPDLPDDVGEIVQKMMQKDPEQRYQTARELLGDLLVLAKRLGLPCGDAENLVLNPIQLKRSVWDLVLPILIPSLLLVVAVSLLDAIMPAASLNHPLVRLREDPSKQVAKVPPQGDKKSATPGKAPTKGAKGANVGTAKGRGKQSGQGKLGPGGGATSKTSAAVGTQNGKKQDTTGASRVLASEPNGGVAAVDDERGSLSVVEPQESKVGTDPSESNIVGTEVLNETKTLVIGGKGQLPNGYERAASFVAALQKAKTSDAITAIELQTDDAIELTPIEIALKQKDFTIRAGAGYHPVLMFRPDRNNDAFRSSGMIAVRQTRIHWQGIQFHLGFAPNAWRDSWSMFEIGQIEKLSFDRCVLTIRNLNKEGKSLNDKVAFMSLSARPTMGKVSNMREPNTIPIPEIRMTRCIVRGQATMIRAKQVVPFQLYWEQGLFVSTERMVETGGAPDRPKFEDGRAIDIRLQNVTVVADQGLCLLRMDQDSPYQLDLFTNCTKCIFAIGKDAALFEYVGRESENMLRKPASVSGKYNFYQAKFVLRLAPDGVGAGVTEFALDENRDRWIAQEKWYNEKTFRAMVPNQWQRARPTSSIDQHGPEDYLIVRDGMPARVGQNNNETAGFDTKSLPLNKKVVAPRSGA